MCCEENQKPFGVAYSEFQALQLSSGKLQMSNESLTKAQLIWVLSGSPTHLLLEVGWGTWLVWVLSGVKKGERRRSTQALFAFTDRRTLAIKGTHADDEDDCKKDAEDDFKKDDLNVVFQPDCLIISDYHPQTHWLFMSFYLQRSTCS